MFRIWNLTLSGKRGLMVPNSERMTRHSLPVCPLLRLAVFFSGASLLWSAEEFGKSLHTRGLIVMAGGESAPEVVQVSAPVDLLIGASASIEVLATGSPPLSYQWIHHGTNLFGETNATLSFQSATVHYSGTYHVIISNGVGTVQSPAMRVEVSNPQPLATPIALTGWNADVVAENDSSPLSAPFYPENVFGWFERGLQGHQDGLPPSRSFTSAIDEQVEFAFQPYASSNVLLLTRQVGRQSGQFTLVSPKAYRKLFVLASSGGGSGVGSLTIRFTDGSSSPPIDFLARDWYGGTNQFTGDTVRRPAIGGLAWNRNVSQGFLYEEAQRPFGFEMHQTDIDLETLGLSQKTISAITFTKPGGSQGPFSTGVFALSGVPTVAPTLPSRGYAHFRSITDTIRASGQTQMGNAGTIEARILFPAGTTGLGFLYSESTVGQEQKLLAVGVGAMGGEFFPNTTTQSNFLVSFNQWHHIALVCDGAQTRLYADGQLLNTQPASRPIGNGLGIPTLGAAQRFDGIQPGFVGYIDSLRISKTARYSGNSFAPVKGDFPSDADTLLLYNFDDPPDSPTVTDVSGNGNTGTLGGGFREATSPLLSRFGLKPLGQSASRGFIGTILGETETHYAVRATEDFKVWTNVTNFVSTNALFGFTDGSAIPLQKRFYQLGKVQ
jgi:hypothetical protein